MRVVTTENVEASGENQFYRFVNEEVPEDNDSYDDFSEGRYMSEMEARYVVRKLLFK